MQSMLVVVVGGNDCRRRGPSEARRGQGKSCRLWSTPEAFGCLRRGVTQVERGWLTRDSIVEPLYSHLKIGVCKGVINLEKMKTYIEFHDEEGRAGTNGHLPARWRTSVQSGLQSRAKPRLPLGREAPPRFCRSSLAGQGC